MPFTLNRGKLRVSGGGLVTTGQSLDIRGSATVTAGAGIAVSAAPTARAFPGAEGFGTETTHGRGGTVYVVSNTNDAGAGSLREALEATGPRIIVFSVCGTIQLESRIQLEGEHSNLAVFGQTAPGDGICLKASATNSRPLLEFNSISKNVPSETNFASDMLFQHIRCRHGGEGSDQSVQDNVVLSMGTHHMVFDHCSFTWHNDECISMWMFGTATNRPAHDITWSHCIMGEGAEQAHNLGPLFSGGNTIGDAIYNVSFHNNLGLHVRFRNFKLDVGSQGDDRGVQYINNVHYNVQASHMSFGQNQYSGDSSTVVDVINDYFMEGPYNGGTDRWPFTISQLYASSGDPAHLPPGGLPFPPVKIYLSGNTARLQNKNPSSRNDEANNYNMIDLQYGGETYEVRTQPLTDQPQNPVTIQTAEQAYTALVTNGDVGALPHDSVDARLAAAPENGDNYLESNTPFGGASYPTLAYDGYYGGDPAKPVGDTSGNGLPDYYQVGVLGKSAGDAYNPAATYSLGNGYTDIENWVHSL